MTTTKSLWHVTGADYVSTDPEVDVMVVTVAGLGTEYAVCVSGHKNMDSNEMVSALRAAAAALILASGGDPADVGCGTPDTDRFDTGDQRPS
jgi:hypothetical protein